jgi:HAD superfamily hydrolase (TIGR01484 family)
MILFACDLDNTLIHSYKRADENDICVEIGKDGKKLSYMTPKAYNALEKLRENKNIYIVPLTTRSVEQYQRINLFKNTVPEYAMTSNGGNLLVNGIPDKEWHEDSLKLISDCISEMKKGMEILDNHYATQFPSRFVDELFVFTKSDAVDEIMSILENALDTDKVSLFSNGEKVYILPEILSKGTAVRRFSEKIGFDMTISAGDSGFDIPMLSYTDISVYPSEKFAEKINSDGRKIIKRNDCNYAEFVCSQVAGICRELEL